MEWKPVGDECKKCGSSGAGGPFSIKQECTPEDHSCKGLKLDTDETQDCNKYCPGDSGPGRLNSLFSNTWSPASDAF